MKTLRFIVIAALLLFSGFSHAQQVDLENPDTVMDKIFQIEPDYAKESTTFEYQHRYLGSLFGTFIFQIWEGTNDASVTPLAYAIGFVNIIAMILAVITFLYVYILGAVGTASDASLMGKENSATFIPLRTATGFALLMPVPGIGGGVFSFIQLLIIWIIVTGSNAASVMWHNTVDYIVSNPEQVLGTPPVDPTASYDVAKMMLCSAISMEYFDEANAHLGRSYEFIRYEYSGSNGGNLGGNNIVNTTPTGGQSISVSHDRRWGFLWPIGTQLENVGQTTFEDDFTSSGVIKAKFNNGNCGTVKVPFVDDSGNSNSELMDNYAYRHAVDTAREYLGRLMDDSTAVALDMKENQNISFTNVAEAYRSGEGFNIEDLEPYAIRLKNIGTYYMEDLTFSINNNFNSYGQSSSDKALSDKLKYGGWMNSILWFYERAVFSSAKATLFGQVNEAISFSAPPGLCGDESEESLEDSSCRKYDQEMRFAMKTIDQMLLDADLASEAAKKKAALACGFNSTCGSSNAMGSSGDIGDDVSTKIGVATSILSFLSGENVTDTTGRTNPFTVMSELGHTLNSIAVGTWLTYGAGVSILSGGESLFDGLSNQPIIGAPASYGKAALTIGKNFMMFIMMTAVPMIMAVLANGFILAYVVPFMPVLTWIAMLIGYLMMTIEAVIAAPLAVVMMFTPEGKGIVGTRLQSAINLINACTLRPMLMTLGVLAAIQLSYVAYEILNTFFWQVASNYLHGSWIDTIAVLVVYTTACFQVCKIIVSTIPKLPDQIMQWMSSGVGRQFGEDSVSSVEGSGRHLTDTTTAGVRGAQEAGKSIRRNSTSGNDDGPSPNNA